MSSLKRSSARAARARGEQAAPVIERMKEEGESRSSRPVVIVRSSRESWGRPEWLIPLGILLAAVLAANTFGYWPFGSPRPQLSPVEVERGRHQLSQIEVLRLQAVRKSTGALPESLDELQPGLDSVWKYERIDSDRFRLDLVGTAAANQEGGTIYDANTGKQESSDERP